MLTNKNIAITGVNRGIGLGLVQSLLDNGNNVIALSRLPFSKELLDIKSKESRCLLVELDVSSSSSHENAMKIISENGIKNIEKNF